MPGNGSSFWLGSPITDLCVLPPKQIPATEKNPKSGRVVPRDDAKKPAEISFVRNRMFYARAALNARGNVTFGLRHIRMLSLNMMPSKS